MTTRVQISDDGGDTWRDLDYTDFEITVGLHDRQRVPQATVTTRTRQDIDPAQPHRIQINGETRFRGETESGGTVGRNGNVRLSAQHRFASLVSESVTVDEPTGETSENILFAALTDSERGGSFTLQHDAAVVSLDEYVVENRDVGDVFADVMDRTGYVYWVEPASDTIRVQTRGGRGTWASLSSSSDGISVESYNDGSVETVVNDVAVTPTRGEGDVTGTATNQASIDQYGRRSESYNIAYAADQSESDAVAESLIQPTPLAEGDISIPQTVGNVDEPLVNFTLDVTDEAKGIDVTDLLVERQVIAQGRATVEGGEGRAQSIEDSNRQQRSDGDKTLPGFLVGEGRIGDDSISREKLRDRAVDSAKIELSGIIAENIANSSISEEKIADAAVGSQKVQSLAIEETKIADDAISTPKLRAEAVTAAEILSETITAEEIAAGTIGATRLFIEDWIPIGLEFADDSPFTGDIQWSSHELVYNGDVYQIDGGDTSNRYVFWQFGNGFYSSSDSKPDLDADDALVAINDNGEANQILQATEIHGGSIRTGTVSAAEIEAATITAFEIAADTITADEISAGTITALEIAADTLTANEIDVLNLNAGELAVLDGSEGIEFVVTTFDGDTFVTMQGTSDSNINIGSVNRKIANVFADRIVADSEITSDVFVTEGASQTIRPDSDNTGQVGVTGTAWSEVQAHNFVTASPPRIQRVDLSELASLDWYENPPTQVRQRARELGNSDEATPAGADHMPVELGTMANYLLETCKAQQERIDNLEQRLSAIEEKL